LTRHSPGLTFCSFGGWIDFLESIALHNDKWAYFRGLPNAEWQLMPGVARADKAPSGGWRPDVEKRLFADFKRAAPTFEMGQGLTDFDWLAVAQHCGLPTRLLDWTDNALVAAWFAVADEREYRPKPPRRTALPGIVRVSPRVARIHSQHGLFWRYYT